jgi:hypothetical protein
MKSALRAITNSLIVLPTLWVSPTVFAAAPLCSGVFQNSSKVIAPEVLKMTITDLARLKIEADMSLAAGNGISGPLGLSKSLFEAKFAETIVALKGIKSEAELKKSISEQIAILRRDKDLETQRETKKRALEVQNIAAAKYVNPYKKSQTFVLNEFFRKSLSSNIFAYVKKNNWLLVSTSNHKGHQTFIVDATNGKLLSEFIDASVGKIIDSTFSANRFVVHWLKKPTNEEVLHIFDIQSTKTTEIAVDADMLNGRDARGIQMSPSGDVVLIRSWDKNLKVSVFDLLNLKTGTRQTYELPKGNNFGEFILVNDRQIVYDTMRSVKHVIELYNITTGQTERLHSMESMAEDLKYDAQIQTLFIRQANTGHTSYSIFVKRLDEPINIPPKAPLAPSQIRRISLLPEGGMLIYDWENNANVVTTYRGDLLEQNYSLKFENESPPNYFDPYGATATPDTKTVFEIFKPHWGDSSSPYIEVWTEIRL